jgi:hypothetical protein
MTPKFTQRNVAATQPPKKGTSGTTLMSYSSNKALLDSKSASKVLKTTNPADTKKKLDMLKTGKYQVDLSTGKLYPNKTDVKKSYTATKTSINKPAPKKTVIKPAPVVVPAKKVVAPIKKEGRVDLDKYVERLPGGEYKEISFQQYHGAKGSGRNVQMVSPSMWEKEKNRVTPMKNK